MLIYLDKKKKKLSQWLKRKTTVDFSDWSIVLLFIVGLFAIIYLGEEIRFTNKISAIVLWFTAIVVAQYTKETYWLKQINRKQLEHQRENSLRPIILRSGFVGNWNDVKFKIVDNKLEEGKPLEFTILKNIAKDISGHIVRNRRKCRLLFANKISQIDFNEQKNISDFEKKILKKLYEKYRKSDKLFKLKTADAYSEFNISDGRYVGILNDSKYIKLEGDDLLLTDEGIRYMDTRTDYSLYCFSPNWGWMKPNTLLYAICNEAEAEDSDEENQFFISYKDIEGNKYYTIEDKNFSQKSFKE